MNAHHSQWSGSAATQNRKVGCSQQPSSNHRLNKTVHNREFPSIDTVAFRQVLADRFRDFCARHNCKPRP